MQYIRNLFKFGFISLLILNSFSFISINSYIILPLEYLPKKYYSFIPEDDYTKKPEVIMKELFYKRLITYLTIGTPEKEQMMLIDSDSNDFYLTSLNPTSTSKKSFEFSEFYDFGENLFYNETESSSYILEECHEQGAENYNESCFAKEKIKFDFGKYSSIEEFPIKIAKKEKEIIPGVIGLSVNDSMAYNLRSFLSELKLTNLIKDYYYFFDWEIFNPLYNNYKGNLIIGDLPHNVFPDKYSKEDFVTMKKSSDSSFWTFNMDKIEIESNTKKDIQITNTKVHTFYEFYNVIGTVEFFNEIKELFLNKLKEENKCFVGKFRQNLFSNDDLNYYYCDISVENILYDNLSGIKFYSKHFDYTFELTKDELYYKKGKYIYLTILFFEHLYNDWILGQIFTSKYHFVFHTDSRQISFYKKVNNIISNIDLIHGKNRAKIWTFIIVTCFALVFIGIFIGIVIGIKFIKRKRKETADEELINIDDEYDFTPRKENNATN